MADSPPKVTVSSPNDQQVLLPATQNSEPTDIEELPPESAVANENLSDEPKQPIDAQGVDALSNEGATAAAATDIPRLALDQSSGSVFADESHAIPSAVGAAEIVPETMDQANGGIDDLRPVTDKLSELELQGTAEDQQLIMERLAKIKDHKKQVLDMLDQMKKKEGQEDMDRVMVSKLIGAYDSFKAQEDEYLHILQKIMRLRQAAESAETPVREDSDLSTAIEMLQNANSRSTSSSGRKEENRPLIENKLVPEPDEIVAAAPEEEDGWAQLQTLKNQRDLLKKLVSQQQQMRALQGLQGSAVAQQQEEVQKELREERDLATNRIAEEARSIADKRKELEELKRKLAAIKDLAPTENGQLDPDDAAETFNGEFSATGPPPDQEQINSLHEVKNAETENRLELSGDREALLQEKLRKIKENKAEMERIMEEMTSVQQQAALQMSSRQAETSPAQNLVTIMMNGVPAEPDEEGETEELIITEEDLEGAIHGVKEQLKDLAAVKERLYELQRMTQAFEDEELEAGTREQVPEGYDQVPEGYDSGQTETETEFERETDVGETEAEENEESAYDSRLEEQEQALEELQMERNRLLGIKNQLLKLHQDYQANENPETSGPELGGVTSNAEQKNGSGSSGLQRLLNNSRTSGWPQMGQSVSTTATWGSERSSVDRTRYQNDLQGMERDTESPQVLNSEIPQMSKQATDSSAIINNPRLASFRRNNQLETCSNASTTHSQHHPDNTEVRASLNLRRESEASVAEQYQQLQDHIDSIRSIFHNVSSMYGPGSRGSPSANQVQAPPLLPLLDPVQTVQQQQLLLTQLLACQQQLQMQQLEMQHLRQFCQDLAANQPTSGRQYLNQSHPELANQQPLPGQLDGRLQFDGRPLSSSSLYNLLAPNPYLTYPYYPQGFAANGPMSPARHPWAPPLGNLTQSWHPGLHGSKSNLAHTQNYSATYHPGQARQRRDSSMEESPRETEVKGGYSPASKPPPVPRLDFGKQSNVSGVRQRTGSAVQYGQEKNLVRSSAARSTPSRAGGSRAASLAASQEHLTQNLESGSVKGEGCSRGSTGFLSGEQFDQLREVIYSEVATLISQNEQRPQFLLELFRELQLLQSDYMKTRAVQSIRDLLNRYLTETEVDETEAEAEAQDGGGTVHDYAEAERNRLARGKERKKLRTPQFYYSTTTVDATASETAATSDEDGRRSPLPQVRGFDRQFSWWAGGLRSRYRSTSDLREPLTRSASPPLNWRSKPLTCSVVDLNLSHDLRHQRRSSRKEYAEGGPSTSSISTPEKSSMSGFGSDPMKRTMVERDTKLNVSKRFENFEDIKNVKLSEKLDLKLNNNPLTGKPKPATARAQEIPRIQNGAASAKTTETASAPCSSRVDIGGLEREIETIVEEVIPFLKENSSSSCTPQLLQYLRKLVLTLTITKCVPEDAMSEFFHRQLSTILEDTVAKYAGQKLETCGEELLTDISEVVFNELAFFRLMQNIDTLGTVSEEENRARRKSLATESSSEMFRDQAFVSDEEGNSDSPVIDNKINSASSAAVGDSDGAYPSRPLTFSISELNGRTESTEEDDLEVSVEEARELSASLREFKANTPRLPPLSLSARNPEANTAVAKQLGLEVDTALKASSLQVPPERNADVEEEESESQSMHTAPNFQYQGLISGKRWDSREGSPPDDSLREVEDIPEQLDEQESSESERTLNYPMAFVVASKQKADGMPRLSSDSAAHIDLSFEPHPVDHAHHDEDATTANAGDCGPSDSTN